MKPPVLLFLALISALLLAVESTTRAETPTPVLLEAHKIWDTGQHNAFTDLIRWHDRWWCTFREAQAHVGGDGQIRVITSLDGQAWESANLVAEKGVDLRDPKCSITPDDRLMIVCGGSVYLGTKQLKGRQPRALFSADGRGWTSPQKVLAEGDWLWRVTWHDGLAYGASYHTITPANGSARSQDPAKAGPEWTLKLYRSRDGLKWELVAPLEVPGRPNETTLRFAPNGNMQAMVRREGGNLMGWFGVARPPYMQWTWQESDHRFGGPNFIELPDGRLIAGTRDHTRAVSTLIAQLTEAKLQPLVTLPSGGDNSYPGLVWHEGLLWVSYYSSHEGKTCVYLARIKLPHD